MCKLVEPLFNFSFDTSTFKVSFIYPKHYTYPKFQHDCCVELMANTQSLSLILSRKLNNSLQSLHWISECFCEYGIYYATTSVVCCVLSLSLRRIFFLLRSIAERSPFTFKYVFLSSSSVFCIFEIRSVWSMFGLSCT